MTKHFYHIIILLCFSLQVKAQNEDVILHFDATEFNEKVLLEWEIKQGFTCNGIEILRSIDSLNFEQIGSITGVCGSPAASISYTFTDVFPVKNKINYYRLSLGGIGFSWIVSAEVIDVGENNYILRPNPVEDVSELLFNNESSKLFRLTIYNYRGELVYRSETNGEQFLLNRMNYSPGSYLFLISSDETESTVQGKFAVP